MPAPVIRPLPEPPYSQPMVDKGGVVSVAWLKWINEVVVRIGSKQALSNAQLKTMIDELDVRVTALE